MKHDIYKLAEQYHLNESEQQMFQSLLEAADQNIQYWLYGYGISTGISGTE